MGPAVRAMSRTVWKLCLSELQSLGFLGDTEEDLMLFMTESEQERFLAARR